MREVSPSTFLAIPPSAVLQHVFVFRIGKEFLFAIRSALMALLLAPESTIAVASPIRKMSTLIYASSVSFAMVGVSKR